MARQRKSTFSIGSLMLTSKQEDLCYYEGKEKSI